MLKLLQGILANKITTEDVTTSGAPRMRGQLTCGTDCNGCAKCAAICPTGAVALCDGKPVLDYKRCLFCGKCVEACAAGALLYTDIDTLPEILTDVQMTIEREIRAKLGRSLHVRHLDAGSCNACDFEMGALSNPLYDLHRFGIAFVASPRHADMIMVTGVVTRNLAQAVQMTYEAMEEPKLVMACGACAASGGTYGSTYAIVGALDKVLPVDIAVPGCPPRPSAMLIALTAAADLLKKRL